MFSIRSQLCSLYKLCTIDIQVIYSSETVRAIQKEFGINGFFIEELSLIRNYPEEFFSDTSSEHIQNNNEIIVLEAEPSKARVLGSQHGIRQVEPILKRGVANKGYVSYDDYNNVTDQEYRDRFANKDLIGAIGLINLEGEKITEPSKDISIIDETLKLNLDNLLKYYLLCNFRLSEFIDISGAKNDIGEIIDYMMRMRIEDIIAELKKMISTEIH